MYNRATVFYLVALAWLAVGCSGEDSRGPHSANPNDEHDAMTSDEDEQDAAIAGSDAGETLDAGDTSAGAAADVTVTGPITNGMGTPFTASQLDLAAHGYIEEELFFAGSATAYELTGEMTMDGAWDAQETTQAEYKSRLLVRRPIDAADFNGTVILEWLNVSADVDSDPGFAYNWEEILRDGYVHVGVSAQMTGIEGGGFALLPDPPPPLKMFDRERYGSLSHPGDAYSYDIFTQAALVVRNPGSIDALGGLEPQRLIAYGESQSAMRMVTYVNAVHPLAHAYDGFFIHSRGGTGTPLTDSPGGFGGMPHHIRTDLDVPVFQFQTETDVFGQLAFAPARQPDNDRLRTWEVAGTAHADQHILDGMGGMSLGCEMVNDGPQHFVIKAALHALNLWIADGTEPVHGELLMTDESGAPAQDEHGNTLGGIRTPHVDVPIATYSGLGDAS